MPYVERKACELLDQCQTFVLAVIVRRKGSTPRIPGSRNWIVRFVIDCYFNVFRFPALNTVGVLVAQLLPKNLMIQPFAWQLLHTSAMLKPTTMNSLWKVGNVLMRGMVKDQLNEVLSKWRTH